MSRISLKSLICELTPEEWRKKSEEMFASKPRTPKISPEEEQSIIQQFQALPTSKKKEYAWNIKKPCANCEGEFNLANVGSSHGICRRHMEQQYQQLKKPIPQLSTKGAFDMKNWTPEERDFAVKLYAVAQNRFNRKKANPSTPASTA